MSADEMLLDMEVGQETHSPLTAQPLEQWARSGTMAIGRGRRRGQKRGNFLYFRAPITRVSDLVVFVVCCSLWEAKERPSVKVSLKYI